MSEPLQAVKISDNVFWVGAIDWKIREFHGYSTSRGTTYNAYLILDDTIILIDGVKQAFKEELLTRIRSVIDPSKIDIIVSNHSEMDHSGCLPEIIPEIRPKRVIASTMGVKALQQHFHWDFPVEAVKTGDMLHLGSRSIRFMETRMLHWPDSM
ncbi:MBL fold metallo-hydrolase, partial [bacterium]|nr:MBL fold metallo-hydrolase [candidate division CSSED10-310 bacterium]